MTKIISHVKYIQIGETNRISDNLNETDVLNETRKKGGARTIKRRFLIENLVVC